MFVVIIREKDDSLNVIGPFWHEEAARAFLGRLPEETKATVYPATDREKFGA